MSQSTMKMRAYTELDGQMHQLCQILAKFGRTFVQAREDDSHTNLRLDVLGRRVWGRWAGFGNGFCALCFDLDNQKFHLVNHNLQTLASFQTIGVSRNNVEQSLAQYISQALNGNGAALLDPLHFQIPDYGPPDETVQKFDGLGLDQWFHHRQQADQACGLLMDRLNVDAEIRIWPHHFDTGIYVEVKDKIGVGFGWAMADDMVGEPYFYFSVYGLKDHTIDYSTVATLSRGKWILGEQWNGAVLPFGDVTKSDLSSFLKEMTTWALT